MDCLSPLFTISFCCAIIANIYNFQDPIQPIFAKAYQICQIFVPPFLKRQAKAPFTGWRNGYYIVNDQLAHGHHDGEEFTAGQPHRLVFDAKANRYFFMNKLAQGTFFLNGDQVELKNGVALNKPNSSTSDDPGKPLTRTDSGALVKDGILHLHPAYA